MKFLSLLLVLSAPANLFAQISGLQQKEIDSLKNFIAFSTNDTLVINAYRKWDDIIYISDTDLDFLLNKKIVAICEKNLGKPLSDKEEYFYKKNRASSQNIMANYYSDHGKYDSAMIRYRSSMTLFREIKNLHGLANCYAGIAIIQWKQGAIPEAVDNNLQALAIYDALDEQNSMANVYLNLGIINRGQGNTEEALKNYHDALAIQKKSGDVFGEANCYNNIATVYLYSGDYKKALGYHKKGYELREKIGDRFGLASSSMNLGIVYHSYAYSEEKKGNHNLASDYYRKALENYEKSLQLHHEIGDTEGIAMSNINLGSLYLNLGNKTTAQQYLEKGWKIAEEIKSKDLLKEVFLFKSSLDSLEGDFKNAYFNYRNFISYRDSLINEENTKKIIEQKTKYEYEKRAAADSIAFAKQKEIDAEQIKTKEAQLESEKTQRYSLYGGLMLTAVFSVFLFNRFRVIQRQKKLIENQKSIVEEKQKEIVDSINYAKRLQQAILAPESEIKKYFPDSFLLYMPKDIVAGDFYFFEVTDTHIFYAAADCTGHGVPGALVSVVCSNALTRCVKEFGLSDPGGILDKTRELILDTFSKSGSDVKDGMDISLIAVNRKTNEIKWAGANNPLWIVEGKSHEAEGKRLNPNDSNSLLPLALVAHGLKEIKADKQPIGKTDNPKPFTTQVIDAKKGDWIFIFTDGYADQFGGPKGKKFKYSSLQKLLLENANEQPKTINKKLLETFNDWKGSLEQVDDVCVIGVKFL